ncbi:MAG: histidine phosphatase family protein [Candidatus Omnitrophota bacterium]
MTTRLILVRHGQTPYAREKRYCGLSDIGLDDKGIKEAKALRKRLCRKNIQEVYSSDLKRALDFAKIIFENSSIKSTAQLREMNFGIFEGLTYGEIMEKYPEIYTKWLNDPLITRIPRAESWVEFRRRIKRTLIKMIKLNKNKTLAIVTHAGPIRIILSDILRTKDIWQINPDTASLNIIEYKNKKARLVE